MKKRNYIIDENQKTVYADAKFLNKKEMEEVKKMVAGGYKMLPMKERENQ